MKILLPEDACDLVECWTYVELVGATRFVEGPIDHLDPKKTPTGTLNFTQDPDMGLGKIRSDLDKIQGRCPGASMKVTKKSHWTPPKSKKPMRVRNQAELLRHGSPVTYKQEVGQLGYLDLSSHGEGT
jgi:hypothetical protein